MTETAPNNNNVEAWTNPRGLRLIVCDNDGCLLPEEPEAFDPRRLEPIADYNRAAFASKGRLPPLTIATGRPGPFVELLLRLIQCETIPAICEHGVITYSLAENEARLDPDVTDHDLGLVRAMRDWLRAAHPDWIQELGKEATVSVFVPGGGEEVDRRMEAIRRKVDAEGWPMNIARTVTYVNATLRHVSKGSALARVLPRLGIDANDVLAIGDTRGDLVLRELCGHFASPANAVEEVKQRSDYVSPHAMTEGVIDIVRHFLTDPR